MLPSHRDEQSLLGALFQTVLQLSATIGICVCSLVQTVITRHSGDLRQALEDAFWVMAGFAWFCTSLWIHDDSNAHAGTACLLIILGLRKVGLAKDVGRALGASTLEVIQE